MDQPISIEAFFKDLEAMDFTSSDEEEMCKAEFTKDEIQKLCQFIPCTVNMKRNNLYYAFEKKIREQFMRKNIHVTHEKINKLFKKKFTCLYHEKYIPNEKIHEKNLRREKRFRRWDNYLYLRNGLNNDTVTAQSNSSQTETNISSKSFDTVICTPRTSQSQEAQVCEINGPPDNPDPNQLEIISKDVDNISEAEIIPDDILNNDEFERLPNICNNNNDQVEIINNDNSEEELMPFRFYKYLHNGANKPYQSPTYSQFKSAMIHGPITSTQQSPTSP